MPFKDKEKAREYARIKAREYRLADSQKQREASKRYRERHPEKIKEYAKKYEKTPQGKARQKRWRQRHPDQVKKRNDKWNKINQGLRFKGKQIGLENNPRTGICHKCNRSVNKGEIKYTNLHHEKYDDSDPLAHTIELCIKCHNKKHPKLRNRKGQFV